MTAAKLPLVAKSMLELPMLKYGPLVPVDVTSCTCEFSGSINGGVFLNLGINEDVVPPTDDPHTDTFDTGFAADARVRMSRCSTKLYDVSSGGDTFALKKGMCVLTFDSCTVTLHSAVDMTDFSFEARKHSCPPLVIPNTLSPGRNSPVVWD